MTDTKPTTTRINCLDLLKFFAIACVILGHSVEQTTGDDFWTNPLWSFIYSYHMPLFMLLCGYFFSSSLRRPFGSMLRSKTIQLIVPTITLTGLIYGLIAITGYNPVPEFFGPDLTSVLNVLWFLKCVFLCYIIAYVSMKLFRSIVSAAIVTSVIFTIIPGGDVVNLNFLLPMFWIGYSLHVWRERVERHRKSILAVTGLSFVVMLCFWSGTLTVYAVPIDVIDWHSLNLNLPNLGVTLYRLAIGAAGSLMFFMLAAPADRIVSKWRCYPTLLAVGKATLGIYVVQTVIVECGIHIAHIYLSTTLSLIVAPLLAVCGLTLCYLCVRALRIHRLPRLLFLGEIK